MKKIIQVTENFRIVVDKDQYEVEQLTVVDPSKAPRNKNKILSEEEKKIKEVWRGGKYYSLSDSGLKIAIKNIILKESALRGEEKVTLREYLNEVKKIANQVTKAVDESMGTYK